MDEQTGGDSITNTTDHEVDNTKKLALAKTFAPRNCTNSIKNTNELFQLYPTFLFIVGFFPPLFGAIIAIVIALEFHADAISNYSWLCGRARFPSLSRIINLPLERTFWQLFILFHIPIRLFAMMLQYVRYGRLLNIRYKHKRFYKLARLSYLYVGLTELFFLAGLSIDGEREHPIVHVTMFYIFGFSGIGFFIANLICYRQSLYYLKPYGLLSYYVKIYISILYALCIPILAAAFVSYFKLCVTIAYDIFALCEYIAVLLNIGYHGCVFFDFRYKIICSVRIMDPAEKQLLQQNSIFNFRCKKVRNTEKQKKPIFKITAS